MTLYVRGRLENLGQSYISKILQIVYVETRFPTPIEDDEYDPPKALVKLSMKAPMIRLSSS